MFSLRRIRFYIDNLLGSGSNSLIYWLALVSFGFICLVAVVAWVIGISDHDTFGDLLWDFMMRAITPWEIEASMGNLPYLLVLLILTLFGIFVLSILISFLSAIIDSRVKAVAEGVQPFPFSGHIVILGWSSRLPVVLDELLLANESESQSRVIIVSSLELNELELRVNRYVNTDGNTTIFRRSRTLASPDTFSNVNAIHARRILVLGDSDSPSPELDRLQTTVAIFNHFDSQGVANPPAVVVESCGEKESRSLRLASRDRVIPIDINDLPARLIIETVYQSNLPSVYEELLSFEGNEIYIIEQTDLIKCAGMSFVEAQRLFETSVLIGFIDNRGEVCINPLPSKKVELADKLIFIAEDDTTIQMQPAVRKAFPDSQYRIDCSRDGANGDGVLDVLLLGVSSSTPQVLNSLAVSGCCALTLLCPQDSDLDDAILHLVDRGHLRLEYGYADEVQKLQELDIASKDVVIVGGGAESISATDLADLTIMRSIIILKSPDIETSSHLHMIAELHSSNARDLIKQLYDLDFVVSEKVGSQVIAQYVENPHLASVIDQLICSGDHGLRIKSLNIPKDLTTFGDVRFNINPDSGILIGLRGRTRKGLDQTFINPGDGWTLDFVGEPEGIFVE